MYPIGKIIEVEQGTPEWINARLGRATGSRIGDAVRKLKSGAWGADRRNYLAELVSERLTKKQYSSYVTPEMQRGTEMEPHARAAFEFLTGLEVRKVGFVEHPSIEMCGSSPDGLIGDEGGWEVKCPNTATHIDTLFGDPIDPDYIKQIQWNMACTGRRWWYFCSYDDRLPAEMRLHYRMVDRDDKMILELEKDVARFVLEVSQKVEELHQKFWMD